jgi:DNA repair protein RecO (recombination protein O)
MNLPRFLVDEAIVLKRTNYGEADRLVTILTKNYGRLTVLAKGVRKLNSKKSAHLEPFTYTKVNILGGYSLPLITQAQTVDSYNSIRGNFDSTKLAFRIMELVEKLTIEGESYPHVFEELAQALTGIESGQGSKPADQFLASFLSSMGYGNVKGLSSNQIETFLEKILDRKLSSSAMV